MATTTNVHEAKSQLSKLIDAALRGETVIIARNGTPAVTLVPVEARTSPRRPGRLRGQIVVIDADWWRSDEGLNRLFYEGESEESLSEPSPS